MCRPNDLLDQTANNIRLFTNCILESYDLKREKVLFVLDVQHIFLNKIVEHVLCKSGIDCDDIQRMFNDVHNLFIHIRRPHNQ
ncbi:unnamed protein product [Rotaria sordida]|uniref:Uncharacterized protein n=1 Tax=Rotaria sordida TaxID=392033 RepID=A0A814S896_9BILA|nr:unnamed protein product [Rotaria sordida]CAF1385958.1 unnamed protein product [Rotaria sordida]